MKLKFNGSNNPTIGIEMEFQLVDKESLDLVPLSEQILNVAHSNGEKRITAEIHQSQIEINSEIGNTIAECRLYLKKRIEYLIQVVEQFGLKLAITGTHPFQKWPERLISNYIRYQNLHKKYQWIFRRMNVYGLHVHIGVKNGDRAIAISNELSKYLPHLIALSANSPFWQSIDTGMKSSRINILESFPFSKIPCIKPVLFIP
jgi:carboxylate-amine ligase